MIELIDQYIVGRLERIMFGDTKVKVYPYQPGREQGETIFPCAGLALRGVFQSFIDARPNCEVITEKGDDITIDIQQNMGGGQDTGPPEYDFKPYPTPVELVYELGVYATRVSDHRKLIEGVYQAFPVGHTPALTGQKPLFAVKDIIEDDNFEKPLFVKIFMLRVTDLWLDRAEIATYASIQSVDFDCQSIE